MEGILREWLPTATIGKILIQRDESTAQPEYIYKKLPDNLSQFSIILLVHCSALTNGSGYTSCVYCSCHGLC